MQGERDGWTAMLRMAMEEIEFHRKNALQGQAAHVSIDVCVCVGEMSRCTSGRERERGREAEKERDCDPS